MEQEQRRKQSFLLRLPFSVREQATLLAREEGTSLNHFISLAVAEKISRMNPPAALKQTPTRMEELVPAASSFRNFRFPRLA